MSAQGILASYEYLDSTVDAIENLKKAGFDEIKAYAPYPEHHIEHALGYGQSPVRVWTLVGALTGTSTAFAFTSWTSVEWPLVVGGKPIISIPAFIPIVFEMSVLFGALATVIGLFVLSKLPNVKPAVVYDPEFTAGRYGVYVEADASRLEEARKIMNAEEPIELREGAADA
ncbi:MAG: DUF3341 domain-containing protein [Gemmatimonadota bacterium]|nr:DUF3341 domain-containing protein [Gemmatimonadota bacterium]MDE3005423.1 DUF3341 domain-containing protein [Gemmatimonadota bacterium]MDE3012529.1 DUF3341 domain-containing protein [Gemmatimonadota bacterium]